MNYEKRFKKQEGNYKIKNRNIPVNHTILSPYSLLSPPPRFFDFIQFHLPLIYSKIAYFFNTLLSPSLEI